MKHGFLYFLSLVVLSLAVGCNSQKQLKGFTVKGKITNNKASHLVLQEFTPSGLLYIDSASVQPDGTFEFTGSVAEPTFCVITLERNAVVLLVDTLSQILLSVDANNPQDYTAEGMNETEALKSVLKLNNDFMMAAQAIEQQYLMSYGDNVPPIKAQEQLRITFDSLTKNRDSVLMVIALSLNNSLIPYFITNFLLPKASFEFLQTIDSKGGSRFASSKYAMALHSRVMNLSKTAIGKPAPDIVLQDIYGKPISLSSFRGKTVLVDFWASWCKPCREESPRLVSIYNKYKTRNFDILSVSLDDNREAWQKAINDDKLLWTHVSDLMKWNSSVVSLYNIEGIPFTVLVDPEGKIIATHLRGKALEDKLAELFK